MAKAAEKEHDNGGPEVWITGIGLVSSLGEGLEAHRQALMAAGEGMTGEGVVKPVIDEKSFAPHLIHPICGLDFSAQISKRGDLRQMEDWQRIGVYAAGLALDMAGVKGDEELLGRCNIVAAAGNGERDAQADSAVLAALGDAPDWEEKLNEQLLAELRPTLYLAQQTQLLAGNISIVHKVAGGSRTLKGEEAVGAQIFKSAFGRIRAGMGDLFLVGAANNAARPDLLLIREMNGLGDIALGSMGAFVVMERAKHAIVRGAKPLAKITDVTLAPANGEAGGAQGPVCSIALGEREVLGDLAKLFGHGIEAQFPLAMALGALLCMDGGEGVGVSAGFPGQCQSSARMAGVAS
jgi:3-oxoacyl-[acyl-carrier-protein] synthase II